MMYCIIYTASDGYTKKDKDIYTGIQRTMKFVTVCNQNCVTVISLRFVEALIVIEMKHEK